MKIDSNKGLPNIGQSIQPEEEGSLGLKSVFFTTVTHFQVRNVVPECCLHQQRGEFDPEKFTARQPTLSGVCKVHFPLRLQTALHNINTR